jgi:tetratricopeptide (TPR) repeat protein
VSDRVEQMEKILKERGMDILFARVASNLLKKGNTDEAVNICENGLKKYPSYAQAHFILASCYVKLEKHNEAKSELERTLKFDPGHLRALKMLSDLYQKSGMEVSYKDILQKLHALDPLNDEITQNVKKLGIYIPWPKIQLAGADAKETNGKNPSVDKVDLSQFDNRDDDFTTILSGKTEDNDDHGSGEPVPEVEAVVDIGEDTEEKPLEYEELDELEFDKEEGTE